MRFFRQNRTSIMKVLTGCCLLVCLCSPGIEVEASGQKAKPVKPQCGHWTVLRCCEILGAPVTMKDVMRLLPPEDEGHTMYALLKVLEKIGLSAEGRRQNYDKLMGGSFPVVNCHISPVYTVS